MRLAGRTIDFLKSYRNNIDAFFFCQVNALKRISIIRISLSFICLILITLGPYGRFYIDTADFLLVSDFFIFKYLSLGDSFFLLKTLIIISGFTFGLGLFSKVTGTIFSVSFFIFNYYISAFDMGIWNYNTHLNFFLIALCCCENSRYYSLDAYLNRTRGAQPSLNTYQIASFALAFMQLYIAVLYFQSGISKLIYSGLNWFLSGQTLFVSTIRLGTPFGISLTQYPILFKASSIFTGLFEIGFLLIFHFRKFHKLLSLVAISFHLGIFAVMDISFWHLWFLFPSLFWINNRLYWK